MVQLLINIPLRQARVYAVFLVLYEFLTYIANDMIMPGMISVVHSFRGQESEIATSLTAYVLGGASLQIFLGPISDRYGRRPVMLFGAMFFFLCTLLIAYSSSMNAFLWARFFQGMGLCFIGVVGYATLQEIFAEMDAIRLIAVMANVAILAPLIGPLAGAVFIYYYSWRMIFVLIGGCALFALWGLWRFMPESVGQEMCKGERVIQTSFSARVVAKNYLMLLKNPSFIYGALALGFVYLPCMAWIALSPIMLVNVAHLTLIQYSFWQIPVFAAFILGNVVLQRMTHRGTIKKMIWVGSIVACIGMLMIYLLPLTVSAHFGWLMPGLVAYFFGVGLIGAPLGRLILFSTHVSKGTASALMSMISMCVQSVGIELANVIYTTHNNCLFGLYCAVVALIYIVCIIACFAKYQTETLTPPIS